LKGHESYREDAYPYRCRNGFRAASASDGQQLLLRRHRGHDGDRVDQDVHGLEAELGEPYVLREGHEGADKGAEGALGNHEREMLVRDQLDRVESHCCDIF